MQSAGQRKKIITFSIQSARFGVRLSDVVEVIEAENIMKLPDEGAFLFAIYRKETIPVFDAAAKFGFEYNPDEGLEAKVMVFEIPETVGLLVPSPIDIIEFSDGAVGPVPRFVAESTRTHYISGLAINGNDIVLILDIDELFSESELARARKMVETSS